MAPICVKKSVRIPLSMVPDSNVSTAAPPAAWTAHQIRTNPYARQMFARFLARKMPGGVAVPPKPAVVVVTPVRQSALTNVAFTLPLLVGQHYELQQPWIDEVDWFEGVHSRSGERILCKVVRTGDARGAEIAVAEARLAGSGCSNPVREVIRQSLPGKPATAAAAGDDVPDMSLDFVIYPYLDYRQCLHTDLQAKLVLSEAEVRHLFREICDIVRAGHRAGVALRDLKLRRLVWKPNSNRSGGLMLCHLENCSVFNVDGGDEAVCENQASPSYVSPEMCSRTGRDKLLSLCKVDIWCLGIILFALVMGRYPFHDTDTRRLMLKVAAAQLPPLPGHLSPELRQLLALLLHVDPIARPDIDALFAHPWLLAEGTSEGSGTASRRVPGGL